MRRRIYYLLPDVATARHTMDDLLLARVDEGHIHFLAKSGIDMSSLHEANLLQSSDIVRSAQFGLLMGAATGFGAGAAAVLIGGGLPAGLVILIGFLTGGLLGAWGASMIGISVPNARLRPFQAAVERGEILLMVDVPKARVEEIEALLQRLDPKAHLEGIEINMPAFP